MNVSDSSLLDTLASSALFVKTVPGVQEFPMIVHVHMKYNHAEDVNKQQDTCANVWPPDLALWISRVERPWDHPLALRSLPQASRNRVSCSRWKFWSETRSRQYLAHIWDMKFHVPVSAILYYWLSDITISSGWLEINIFLTIIQYRLFQLTLLEWKSCQVKYVHSKNCI